MVRGARDWEDDRIREAGVFHLCRRLNGRERTGMAVRDIRGTPEALARRQNIARILGKPVSSIPEV